AVSTQQEKGRRRMAKRMIRRRVQGATGFLAGEPRSGMWRQRPRKGSAGRIVGQGWQYRRISIAPSADPQNALAMHSNPVRQAAAGNADWATRPVTRSSAVTCAMVLPASNIERVAWSAAWLAAARPA